MSVVISKYGCRFPGRRVTRGELQRVGIETAVERVPVAAPDEDALTAAAAAAKTCDVDPGRLRVLSLASTTLPYRRRVQSGMIAEVLGCEGEVMVTEHTTSFRSGTEAMLAAAALLALEPSGKRDTALVVAAETPEEGVARQEPVPASVAFALGGAGGVASLASWASEVSEAPGLSFVPAGERRTHDIQVPGYSQDVEVGVLVAAARRALSRAAWQAGDVNRLVLEAADPRVARAVLRALDLKEQCWRPSWTRPLTGGTGAAAPLLSLAVALDASQPGERILLLSYGSGSSADALAWIAGPQAGQGVFAAAFDAGVEITGAEYLRLRGVV